jgi:hypothetical protein
MRGYDDPRPSRTWRPGRWLALLTVAVVLAGCGGGGGVAAPTGDGGTTNGGTTNGGTTNGGTTNGGTTNGGEPPVGIDLGGPSVGSPGPPIGGWSFGEVAVGSRSSPLRFELRNPLEFGFSVMGLTVEGDGSIALTEDRCSGVDLPARTGACALAVEFAPRHEGTAVGRIIARMTHTCTSTRYQPCDQDPHWGEGEGKNFSRTDGPNGEVTFIWTSPAGPFSGTGTAP